MVRAAGARVGRPGRRGPRRGSRASASVTTRSDDWELSFAVLARGYFLAAREAFRVLSSGDMAAPSSSSAPRTRSSQGRTPRLTLRRKRPPLHLGRCLAEEGGPHGDPRQHCESRRRDPGIEHLVHPTGRRSAQHVRRERGRAADLLPGPHEARRAVLPEDVAEAIAFFVGPRSNKSTGNVVNVDGGVTAAYPR